MLIFPAIDIIGGSCVRLHKGDFDTAYKVADNPLDTAKGFEAAGARWIHMVDLDGAKSGKPANSGIFLEVAGKTGLNVQLGGGIRDIETIDYYLENGISRVILGSAALRDPELVANAVQKYGEKIAVGVDALDGTVKADGWLSEGGISYLDLAKEMEQLGVKYIIFTDIDRDGVLEGPNILQLAALAGAVKCDIIASGGIRDIDDIKVLSKMGLYGAICGKAIYGGSLDLAEAVRTAL